MNFSQKKGRNMTAAEKVTPKKRQQIKILIPQRHMSSSSGVFQTGTFQISLPTRKKRPYRWHTPSRLDTGAGGKQRLSMSR
jgi:hypothetical protein